MKLIEILKKRINRKVVIRQIDVNFMLITGMMFTLFLITLWPRFRSDAMSVEWYWYLGFTIFFFLLYAKKVLAEKY